MVGLNAKPQRAAAHAELSLLMHVIQPTAEPAGPVRKWQLYGLNKDSRKKKIQIGRGGLQTLTRLEADCGGWCWLY